MPKSDWMAAAYFVLILGAFLALIEWTAGKLVWPGEFTRKLVHVLTGFSVVAAMLLIPSWQPLFWVGVLFVLINSLSLWRGTFGVYSQSERRSLGTVFYPFSFALLMLVLRDAQRPLAILAFSFMAFADALAAFVGQKAPAHEKITLPGDAKSIRGSLAMFAGSFFIALIGNSVFELEWSVHPWVAATFIALVATAAEALSYRGSDNLTVPLLSALALYLANQNQFYLGEALALGVVVAAYAFRVLDPGGAIAAFLVGTIVFGIGGWAYSIPLLLFFVLSSLLSKIPGRSRQIQNSIAKGSPRRDAKQVLANGLLPAVLTIVSIFYHENVIFFLYLSALAAVTADTWATEIGLTFSSTPRSIVSGRPVAPGTSGGISMAGTAGALLGALVIALSGWYAKSGLKEAVSWSVILAVSGSGMIAHLVDSLLGATVQRRNQCPRCGVITESDMHCRKATRHIAGWRWLDNDAVNLCCGTSGVLIFLLLTWT